MDTIPQPVLLSVLVVGFVTSAVLLTRLGVWVWCYILRPSSLPRYLHGETTPWALVTGASDGIGKGFAKELLAAGFNVILHGRNPTKLANLKREFAARYPNREIDIAVADASAAGSERAVVKVVGDRRLTVLVNNVGGHPAPPDDELQAALLRYATQHLKLEVQIANLKADLDYSIGLTKLKQLRRKFKIPTVRKPPPLEVARQAIVDKVAMDISQGNGPKYFKTILQQEGIMIPRDTVRKIMLEHFPLGFENRFPGKRKTPIPRTALYANGPFHEVSSDGHEKLGKQALEMGDIGLPMYGYKDKWTDDLLFLQLVPNSRTAAAIGHLYLDFIQATGAIPIQLTTDKGSEIGWQYAIQDALRHTFAPDIDPEVYPICRIIKSVHNTIIEALWRWFKEKKGLNLKAIIFIGKQEHIFNENVAFHTPLFYWIFVPLLQAELDEFRTWWNHHRVRTQKDKTMPSGHVPADALDHPQNYGGLDCSIPVPPEAVDDLRGMVTEDVGPRDAHLSWFTAEFDDLANEVYTAIGKPELSLETAWNVFLKMSAPMAHVIET